jgi:hypothetical protein
VSAPTLDLIFKDQIQSEVPKFLLFTFSYFVFLEKPVYQISPSFASFAVRKSND